MLCLQKIEWEILDAWTLVEKSTTEKYNKEDLNKINKYQVREWTLW